MMLRRLWWVIPFVFLMACASDEAADPNSGFVDGEPFDEREDPATDIFKNDRPNPYQTPTDLPRLKKPEVIISLSQLTVHLFDRETGFSRVYPTGVGTLGRNGLSITPTGHFKTSPDPDDRWWNIPARWAPEYFEGYPFIRLTAENSRGYNTYGLHGPITNPLRRDYVSHGCMRMNKADIVDLFYMLEGHANTPVSIQQEAEVDAAGNVVDVDSRVALWKSDEDIEWGASVGQRPTDDRTSSAFIGEACTVDEQCDPGLICYQESFCTKSCEGTCPDRSGKAGTFCVKVPGLDEGMCVAKEEAVNNYCDDVPGTIPVARERFVGSSNASARSADVCYPAE